MLDVASGPQEMPSLEKPVPTLAAESHDMARQCMEIIESPVALAPLKMQSVEETGRTEAVEVLELHKELAQQLVCIERILEQLLGCFKVPVGDEPRDSLLHLDVLCRAAAVEPQDVQCVGMPLPSVAVEPPDMDSQGEDQPEHPAAFACSAIRMRTMMQSRRTWLMEWSFMTSPMSPMPTPVSIPPPARTPATIVLLVNCLLKSSVRPCACTELVSRSPIGEIIRLWFIFVVGVELLRCHFCFFTNRFLSRCVTAVRLRFGQNVPNGESA